MQLQPQAQNEVVVAGAQRNMALQDLIELQAVACGPIYERVFNKGISRAKDNYDRQVAELRPWDLRGGVACLTN